MSSEKSQGVLEKLCVRTYKPKDQPTVSRLYTDGLLAGQIPPHDTGSDIGNIQEAYFSDDCNHLWVAELDTRVFGIIGVIRSGEHSAQIRRLRVEKDWQNTPIAARLLETALAHCKHHGYIKVVLDTRFDPEAARDLFDRFGFQHTRTKSTQDKELLEFYLDLYRLDKNNQGAA